MLDRPSRSIAIPRFQGFHRRVAPFAHALAEKETGQNWRDEHRKYERPKERKCHGPGHGLEQATLYTLQCENGQIRRDDDGDRVEHRALDFMRGLTDSLHRRL